MRSVLGIVLIVFGVLAGASAASINMRPEAKRLPPAERLGQAIGGSLCSLTLVGGGFLLARSGVKKPKDRGQPRGPSRGPGDGSSERPGDRGGWG